MSNPILPKRGDEANRATSSAIVENEVHVSKNNAGAGADTRFWVRGSGGLDTLVGPYEFVAGNQISVSTDTTTGRVTIGYQEAATFNPSFSLTRSASSYGGSPSVIEVGDSYSGGQTYNVAIGNGANEVEIDRAQWTRGNTTASFAQPLGTVDGDTATSGSYVDNSVISAPTDFRLASNTSRRTIVTMRLDADDDSSFGFVNRNQQWNWGWRLVPFISTTKFVEEDPAVTSSLILNNLMKTVSNGTPTTTNFNQINQNASFADFGVTLPANGTAYYPYIAFTIDVPEVGTNSYGWEPNGVTLLPTSPLGFTEVYGKNTFPWQGSLGGQNTAKQYAIYRIGSSTGYVGSGQSLTFRLT